MAFGGAAFKGFAVYASLVVYVHDIAVLNRPVLNCNALRVPFGDPVELCKNIFLGDLYLFLLHFKLFILAQLNLRLDGYGGGENQILPAADLDNIYLRPVNRFQAIIIYGLVIGISAGKIDGILI